MIETNFSAISTGTAGIVTAKEIGAVGRLIAGGGMATIMEHGDPLIDGKQPSLSFGKTQTT